jgi:tetratricopeptide (TPR) repeat protein
MKVFISWSGPRSKTLALYVHDWLKAVIQRAEPWMSERDIQPGQRWNEEISTRLKDTNFGIICLTPENLNAPWLLFEAGALAEAVESAHVVPLLFGMRKAQLTFPLAQFQSVEADQEGFLALASAINRALGDQRLDANVLASIFSGLWPGLASSLKSVAQPSNEAIGQADRSDREILEELLSSVRGLQRAAGSSSWNQSLTKTDSMDWEDYYLRGVHLANKKGGASENLAALRAYSEAIALAPLNLPLNLRSRLFAYRAAMLKRLGRLDEAEHDLVLAQGWATEDREINDAMYNLACVMAMKTDYEASLRILEQLFKRDPDWIDIVKTRTWWFGKLLEDHRFKALTEA